MSRYAIVINKQASRAEQNLDTLKNNIKKSKKKWVFNKAVQPEKLEQTIEQAIEKKPDVLILAGGDGTVISGIETAQMANFEGQFAIIPLGTANYLARNLSIPLAAVKALKTATSGSNKQIYLGSANGRLFSLMATIGLTTEVSKEVSVKQKKRYGQLAYIASAIKILPKQNQIKYRIMAKDLDHSGITHQIIVLNADLNQHVNLTPSAELHKAKLRVVIYDTKRSLLKILFSVTISIISLGKIQPGLHNFEVDTATIETEPKLEVAVDGELHTNTPMEIVAVDAPISIRVPTDI